MASRLQRKLQSDVDARREADQRVEKMESLRPQNDEEKGMVDGIISGVSEEFKAQISKDGMTPEVVEAIATRVQANAADAADDYETQQRVKKIVLSTISGLGPIDSFAKDPEVEDIVVQRYDNIVIVKGGKRINTSASFQDDNHLITVINRIVQQVGRQINLYTPTVDARLPDGSRVNATIKPISPDGATLTIRRFPDKGFSADDYLRLECLDGKILELISKAVRGKANLIVGGGTGSGKTTLLNMLSGFIPEDELIVTIEDSCELRLTQRNVRRLEARPASGDAPEVGILDLLKNALRMTIDRAIVGEARDGTIVGLFTAMSTGHDGSMSTLHCNDPLNMVNSRIPTMYSMYKDGSFSPEGQALQMAEALDMIVYITRLQSGEWKGRRVISHVTSVEGVDERNPQRVKLVDIFRFDKVKGEFYATGYVPKALLRKLSENGVYVDESIFAKTGEGSGD